MEIFFGQGFQKCIYHEIVNTKTEDCDLICNFTYYSI